MADTVENTNTQAGGKEAADVLYNGDTLEQAPDAGKKPQAETPETKEEPTPQPSKDEGEKSEATDTKGENKDVPEKYDLKLPEASTLDKSHADTVASFAKEHGLSNKQAQAILERDHQIATGQKEHLTKMHEDWISTLKADKEFGGERLAENDKHAYRFLRQFGSEDLIKMLDETNYKAHPEVFKMMARAGRAMADDKAVLPGAAPAQSKRAADLIYGDNEQQKE